MKKFIFTSSFVMGKGLSVINPHYNLYKKKGKKNQFNLHAGQALKMSASCLSRNKTAIGDYYRRMRAKLGGKGAVLATAHKLARIIYDFRRYFNQRLSLISALSAFCFFLFFTFHFAFSQISKASGEHSRTIDSLETALQTATHDTTRAGALLVLGEELYISKPDTALLIWQQVLKITENGLKINPSQKIKTLLLKHKASTLNNIGYIYNHQGQIKEALEYYGRSLKIMEDIGDKQGIAISLNNLGSICKNQSQIKEALEYYGRSLKIKEEIGDKQGIAISLNNIGLIYNNQGRIKEALANYGRSLKILEEIGNKRGIAATLINIGYIYNHQGQIKEALEYYGRSLKILEEIGDKQGLASSLNNIGAIYENQGQTKEALDYFGRSLKIRENIGDKQGIAWSLNNIGAIYEKQGRIKEALDYYQKGLKTFEKLGDKHGLASSLNNIGAIYLKEKDLAKAKAYSNRCLTVAKEMGYTENIRDAAKLQADIYKTMSNYKAGWEMYELYILMRDSVKNKENEKAAIRQHTKYEFEKAIIIKEQKEKEQQRQLQEAVKRRNILQYSGIMIVVVLLFIGFAVTPRLRGVSRLMPVRFLEGGIFFTFLLFFEFLLVLLDPYMEQWTGGAPILKLLFNAGIAALIFPLHAFFESLLKKRLLKAKPARSGSEWK